MGEHEYCMRKSDFGRIEGTISHNFVVSDVAAGRASGHASATAASARDRGPDGGGRRIHLGAERDKVRSAFTDGSDVRMSLQRTPRRPVTRLTTRTITAITSRMWMSPPAIWKLKPRSHRTSKITKIVQSIGTPFRMAGARNLSSIPGAHRRYKQQTSWQPWPALLHLEPQRRTGLQWPASQLRPSERDVWGCHGRSKPPWNRRPGEDSHPSE